MARKKVFDGKVKILYELDMTDNLKLRFSLMKFPNGKKLIDTRVLYRRAGDEWMFSKKGFTINVNDYEDFTSVVKKILKYVNKHDIVSKEVSNEKD